MRRRQFLAAASTGLLGGLAGCSAEDGRGFPTAQGSGAGAASGVESDERESAAVDGVAFDDDDTGAGSASQIYRAAIDSVVGILVYDRGGRAATGSGFVTGLGPGGPHVVTNQHVVAPGNRFQLRFRDDEWRSASLVGTDVYSDLAVLRPDDRPASAGTLPWADTNPESPVGTEVLAIGTPFDLGGSASRGIISGVDRLLPAPNSFSIPDAVQTDAALNPGNSGGPIVTAAGEVAAVASSAGGENIGFGISAALSKRVIPELIADGEYGHSLLGVGLREVTPTAAEVYDLDNVGGLIVTRVVGDGPSDDTLQGATGSQLVRGVQVATGGDVIVGIGGVAVETQADLSNYLALETSPGDTVPVTVVRDGDRTTVEVTLARRPTP